jgi:serine/threonine protein phosphatase PrpC/CRP-like cAMP-binding protein
MKIGTYALTDVGAQRKHNEDFMLTDGTLGLHIVCDGMGGHNAGDVASRMAATAIQRVVSTNRPLLEEVASGAAPYERAAMLLRTAIETACQEVYDEGTRDRAKQGMGCTCTAVLLVGGKAIMGHVGDSRLYLCRGGAVTQLSEDHTFVNEAVRQGVFTPEEAAHYPYKNVITRAIGKERTVRVDTLIFDVVLGDTLLLCSDGLHGYLQDPAELARLLSSTAPESLPQHLIALANQRGGADNITAIVLRAKDAGDAREAQRRAADVATNLATLQRIELMSHLTMAEVVRFAQVFQEVEYAPGAIIIREGEISDALFVLVAGTAEVLKGNDRVAVLPAGAHVGEMALLNSHPRSATVRALEACRMLVVDRARLYSFLQGDPMLAAKFFWKLAETLSRRLEEAMRREQEARAQQQPVKAYSGR